MEDGYRFSSWASFSLQRRRRSWLRRWGNNRPDTLIRKLTCIFFKANLDSYDESKGSKKLITIEVELSSILNNSLLSSLISNLECMTTTRRAVEVQSRRCLRYNWRSNIWWLKTVSCFHRQSLALFVYHPWPASVMSFSSSFSLLVIISTTQIMTWEMSGKKKNGWRWWPLLLFHPREDMFKNTLARLRRTRIYILEDTRDCLSILLLVMRNERKRQESRLTFKATKGGRPWFVLGFFLHKTSISGNRRSKKGRQNIEDTTFSE